MSRINAILGFGMREYGVEPTSVPRVSVKRRTQGVSPRETTKPQKAHTDAAEHHEKAAKSHKAAAEHHAKGDTKKAAEHATEAHGHSSKAHEHSTGAHGKSHGKH